LCAIGTLTLFGCGKSSVGGEVDSCVNRGVAYFKEIGSYPTLSSAPNTGRLAEDVARERCNRTTTAF
jgi:hypothetical protein